MNDYHVQCELAKWDNGQILRQTAWIPEQFAVEKNFIKLRDDDKVWTDGWQIMSIGTKLESKWVRDREADHKNMRKMTDI